MLPRNRMHATTAFRVAHASRVLVSASRRNNLCREVRERGTPSPTRETRALPLTACIAQLASPIINMKCQIVVPALCWILVFFAAPQLQAQDEGSIRQAMSPEEFHKAGLDKLSDEELRNLDRWLKGDREKTAKKATTRAS